MNITTIRISNKLAMRLMNKEKFRKRAFGKKMLLSAPAANDVLRLSSFNGC
jgi:hypothetical protein